MVETSLSSPAGVRSRAENVTVTRTSSDGRTVEVCGSGGVFRTVVLCALGNGQSDERGALAWTPAPAPPSSPPAPATAGERGGERARDRLAPAPETLPPAPAPAPETVPSPSPAPAVQAPASKKRKLHDGDDVGSSPYGATVRAHLSAVRACVLAKLSELELRDVA